MPNSFALKPLRIGLQTWGSEGDVQLFMALAAGLAARGHEVELVSSDSSGRDFSAAAAALGFRIRQVGAAQQLPAPEFERQWRSIVDASNPLAQAEKLLRLGFDPVSQPMYEAAKELCRHKDLVIGHFFVHQLAVAAYQARVPYATVSIAHNCIPSREIRPLGFPNLGRWSYPLGWKLTKALLNRVFLSRVNSLRSHVGLRPVHDVLAEVWASDWLNILAVSPSICSRPADWPVQHQISGFLNLPRPPLTLDMEPELQAFLAAGEPPVYFTFGSMLIESQSYVREAVAIWSRAMAMVGRRAIFQIPYGDLGSFARQNGILNLRRADHRAVFPRCAMVVHHGGAGTTQASLLAGVPSVVVAHLGDQFFWGDELERMGAAGRTLKRRGLRPESLARAINWIEENPNTRLRAVELSRKMQFEDGVGRAVALIENRAAQDEPVLR